MGLGDLELVSAITQACAKPGVSAETGIIPSSPNDDVVVTAKAVMGVPLTTQERDSLPATVVLAADS